MTIEVQIRAHAEMTNQELAVIEALDNALFADHPYIHKYTWATPDWHVLVRIQDNIVSYLHLMERQGLYDNLPVKLVGIGAVMTQPRYRGRGLSSLALRQAQEFMFSLLSADFGLLFCSTDLFPFYQSLGWSVMHASVTVEQPRGRITWPEPTMILPRHPEQWQDRQIDLCGYPW